MAGVLLMLAEGTWQAPAGRREWVRTSVEQWLGVSVLPSSFEGVWKTSTILATAVSSTFSTTSSRLLLHRYPLKHKKRERTNKQNKTKNKLR